MDRGGSVNNMVKRYIKLILGLFLVAAGMVIIINADLGYSPWDVFHQGLSNIFGIKIGTANILVGVIIIVAGMIMGEMPGVGTILNMFLIGGFMNVLMDLQLLPIFSNTVVRLLTIPVGMIVIGFGSYSYISAGFGTGPRDGLMVLLMDKTGRSVRFIRNSIEITVLVIGFFLGGPVWIGTVMVSFGLGYALQFVFGLFDFDPNQVDHRGWNDEMKALRRILRSRLKGNFKVKKP